MTTCLATPQTRWATPRLPSVEVPDVPWQRPVGPAWEVVLVPERIARPAVQALDELSPALLGAVFSIQGRWGFFVPEESAGPPWPAGTRYLQTGAALTLPPACWKNATSSDAGWVRRPPDGRLLTPPLILHPMVTAASHREKQDSQRPAGEQPARESQPCSSHSTSESPS